MRKTCPFHDFFLCNRTYRKGKLMFEKPPQPTEELIPGWQYRYLWKEILTYQMQIENHFAARHIYCPIHLYLIFEKSSWKTQVWQTGFLIYFKLDFYCLCSLQKISFQIDFCRLKIQFVELDFSNLIFQNTYECYVLAK